MEMKIQSPKAEIPILVASWKLFEDLCFNPLYQNHLP